MKTHDFPVASSGLNNFLTYLLSDVDSAFDSLIALPIRFLDKVDFRRDGCWQWTAAVTRHPRHPQYAYGKYSVDGTPQNSAYAHRFAYESTVGPIPEGLEIDHVCANKLCVNPSHLRAVTHKANCATRRKRQRVPGSVRWLREQRRANA